jgi:hypothetical protein
MVYEIGTAFAPAVQIDPILPATITYVLTYPDGRTVMARGEGDRFGSFVGKDKWILDIPGVYHFNLEAEWQGYKELYARTALRMAAISMLSKWTGRGCAQAGSICLSKVVSRLRYT